MRDISFAEGEYYHIYNRGVDKRYIFSSPDDVDRFFQSMDEFNVIEPIRSIYENSFLKDEVTVPDDAKLVDFVAFCFNTNHYHFILSQRVEKGIEKFMHRLGNGYTKYFNNKYRRTGALFQGKYKAKHIDSDEYLLHLSAYVNLNHQVHQLGHSVSKLKLISSWDEYIARNIGNRVPFCEKSIILERFSGPHEYEKFAKDSLANIVESKKREKELAGLFID